MGAPLRMAFLPDAQSERLHLTSLRAERIAVVLPALQAPQPEPVELERRKKHWYSRAKYVPKKNPLDNLHVYTRSWHRSGLM